MMLESVTFGKYVIFGKKLMLWQINSGVWSTFISHFLDGCLMFHLFHGEDLLCFETKDSHWCIDSAVLDENVGTANGLIGLMDVLRDRFLSTVATAF